MRNKGLPWPHLDTLKDVRIMNLDEIIESFKLRVNKLSQDWDALTSVTLGTPEDELKLLKAKLDLVQEQNSAIIVDLDHIKKVLNLDDDASNNVFTLLGSAGDGLSDAANIAANAVAAATASMDHHHHHHHHHHPPNTPQSETASQHHLHSHGLDVASISSLATSLDSDLHTLKKRRTSGFEKGNNSEQLGGTDCTSKKQHNSVEVVHNGSTASVTAASTDTAAMPTVNGSHIHHNHISARRTLPPAHIQEIEDYELQMIDNPKSVAELYDEFDNSLKLQILEFEKKFGKGQLSRIPKIRTYQRRRALVSEIDKYARFTNKSTEDAIHFFENIRNEKNKTVAWLYNNLGRVLAEYNM